MDKYIHAIIDPGTGQVYYVNKVNKQMTCLNAEQLKELNAKTDKKESFKRILGDDYYYIDDMSSVMTIHDYTSIDEARYEKANYFKDKTLAEQINLQQLFYRKLLRYAYMTDLVDDKIWDGYTSHYFISCENLNKEDPLSCFTVGRTCNHRLPGVVYFKSEQDAAKAVEQFAEPFLKRYPDFKECF